MKQQIVRLAQENRIDEIRFIDAEDLTETEVGDPSKFRGRQPKDVLPSARTLILAAVYIGKFVTANDHAHGRMSRLVLSGYYANIVKPLKPIQEFLCTQGYEAKVIDGEAEEADIPLKGAAVKAGLGWIGKNSILLNPKYGSFQALGAILTDADISQEYERMANQCGNCSRCMDICPTGAIETPKILTREKCLSHIMDEYVSEGDIPDDVDTERYFFECDICQNSCPWNQAHLKAPLETPYGKQFERDRIEKLLQVNTLRTMDPDTYERELAPLMTGYQLPYKTFRRNLKKIK